MTVKIKDKVSTLEKLDALLATKDNWCKGSMARDAEGTPVSPNSTKAKCFCFLGAIRKVSNWRGLATTEVAGDLGFVSTTEVIDYNDDHNRRFKHIKARIARAIKQVEKGLT